MLIAIRISGMVGISMSAGESLKRIRLRRKYSAVILKPTNENMKILKNLRNYIAYGDISPEVLAELIEKRGKSKEKDKKIDAKKVIEEFEKKKTSELSIKPFFRLHPPRGGIESKKHFGVGKGVLGDHKDKINDLVRRML